MTVFNMEKEEIVSQLSDNVDYFRIDSENGNEIAEEKLDEKERKPVKERMHVEKKWRKG